MSLGDQAERQIGRMERMLGDLLDTARIEAGKLELQVETCGGPMPETSTRLADEHDGDAVEQSIRGLHHDGS